jgi:hypothetical protein
MAEEVCSRCRSYSLPLVEHQLEEPFWFRKEASIDKKSRSFLRQRFAVV